VKLVGKKVKFKSGDKVHNGSNPEVWTVMWYETILNRDVVCTRQLKPRVIYQYFLEEELELV
jgi:hypothetical protein